MEPQKITELANLLRKNGDKILNSEFNFTLSGSLLRALNDSFTLIADAAEIGPSQTFQVVKPINSKSSVFRDLQLIHDFVQKTAFLCIIRYPGDEDYFDGKIDVTKFRSLKRLEVQKTNVHQLVGLQPLRAQIQQLICVKSLQTVDDIITHCGGDKANGFVWNELKIADFSYNQLQSVDTALEFAQYLQHLNLRHNQLVSVEAIKWLPHLQTLDLSFNRLTGIPQFHLEACKRLQVLNMSNNFVEDLLGISKLDALTDLDLSDNCLMDHGYLLPISAILTLSYLNLYGNPLHCHPKHRLATAQFLHKNVATVKFILDFEPLSKKERAIAGTQQMRRQPAAVTYNRFTSYSISVGSSPSRSLSSAQITPSSSVGSLRSFKLGDSAATVVAAHPSSLMVESNSAKKRTAKVRNVEIREYNDTHSTDLEDNKTLQVPSSKPQKRESLTKSLIKNEAAANSEHLTTKQHIETLRKKYGNEWLQSENAQKMHSVLGIENAQTSLHSVATSKELFNKSRQVFHDYLGEFSTTSQTNSTNINSNSNNNNSSTNKLRTSTPTNNGDINDLYGISPIGSIKSTTNSNGGDINGSTTMYLSMDNDSANTTNTNTTLYKSANDREVSQILDSNNADNLGEVLVGGEKEEKEENDDDMTEHLKNVYSTAADEEPAVSEAEDDEETYIVYTAVRNESMFLTISSNFLREKDTLTQRTKNKWSLKILESCDRIKSNTLRINFDTVKVDKQERVYTIEDGLCQELEKKLRDILSQRDLSEMNQTIYRCVNCSCQFSRENKNKNVIRCPNCKSNFVAELHEIPKSLEKTTAAIKLSPAIAALAMENLSVSTPATLPRIQLNKSVTIGDAEETNSIDKGPSRLSATTTTTTTTTTTNTQKSSANSLNESSSCSKISNSQNSQSSFDSNQSVVGSSTVERDAADFKSNYESDVDIISNPSISSIEVLDQQHAIRRAAEERRLLHAPTLETIVDYSFRQSFIDYTTSNNVLNRSAANEKDADVNPGADVAVAAAAATQVKKTPVKQRHSSKSSALAHFNLTESSSSGSVTDSVCTAYEQMADKILNTEDQKQKIIIENLLQAENSSNSINNHLAATNHVIKKEDSAFSSMFGALFQSTNILMSSSKKLLDAEASANVQAGIVYSPLNNNNNNISVNKKSPSKSFKYSPSSIASCAPYKFNYTDFNDVDHRLKLYFYQSKFEEGEHFKWLVRGRIYNVNTHALCTGIVVMSTCKCYVMEMFAPEHDDVTKWLRFLVSVTVDRLENIQLLPWKIGLSFCLRDWGGFLLLLQDILRTDSLLLHFANNSLPSQCELNYQISEQIVRRLNSAVVDEKLKMLSLLNGCEIECENAKRTFSLCGLLTTDTRLYLTSGNLSWLCANSVNDDDLNSETELELCITQFMSNLVAVERPAANVFTVNFLDETQDKYELWKCSFETKENAESCFNAIGQSWEILFGVPLFTTASER